MPGREIKRKFGPDSGNSAWQNRVAATTVPGSSQRGAFSQARQRVHLRRLKLLGLPHD